MNLKTPRTWLKRLPKRGAHDFATIAASIGVHLNIERKHAPGRVVKL